MMASAIAPRLSETGGRLPIRYESRAAAKGLFEFFDGRFFHIVYEVAGHAPDIGRGERA